MSQAIFIIDDDEDDILITQRVIAKLDSGVRIETATSGEAGLALLRERDELPALVLLDRKMPGMDGSEVLRAIRADARLRKIPVVIVSHSALDAEVKESYAAGADLVMSKALDMGRFAGEIKAVLDRWLPPSGSPSPTPSPPD